jgi:hypothetical protein
LPEEFVPHPDAIEGVPRDPVEREVENTPERVSENVPLPKKLPTDSQSRDDADRQESKHPRPQEVKSIQEIFPGGADFLLSDPSHMSFSL